jgi:hypothetical protein
VDGNQLLAERALLAGSRCRRNEPWSRYRHHRKWRIGVSMFESASR